MKLIHIQIFVGLFLALWSCSAPHDNPLDPESDNYVAPTESPTEEPVPTFQSRVRSVHTARLFPTTDSYSVLAELWPDSVLEIDSVRVTYDSRSPVKLSFTSQGIWAASFSSSYFSDDHLESVIGVPFTYRVYTAKDTIDVGPEYLFRVLQETPVVTEPDSNQVVGSRPELQWADFDVLYPHRFQAVVDRVLEFSIVVRLWASDTLAHTANAAQVPDSLEDGEYYWTLYAYDSYANATRSREGYFIVDETP